MYGDVTARSIENPADEADNGLISRFSEAIDRGFVGLG
jgi:hypothetical protein